MTTTDNDLNLNDNDYPVHVPRRGLKLLTIEELAQMFNMPVETAREYVNQGVFPAMEDCGLIPIVVDSDTGAPIYTGE